jgi:predicted RNase H-like nuclease
LIVAGADGCPTGWVVCRRNGDGSLDIQVVKALADICEGLSILAVDMPFGLLDVPRPGGRDCEREARKRLPGKTSSVFPGPCRPALDGESYTQANAISKKLGIGLTRQMFNILPKVREIDTLLRARPELRTMLHEAHPELAFARMNGGRPLLSKKRRPEGYAERRRLLGEHGFPVEVDRIAGAARDDVLDAIACCRTAALIAAGTATRLGPAEARDRYGLAMNIWF